VALKLALRPDDPRFEREAKLLARIRHPGVPRLLGQGSWRTASGAAHPYLAMEWVQGLPLYDWASMRNPSSRQVLRMLAQAARVLEAVHGARSVHRDIKGGNVLVRPGDGRVFLTDFGSGHYAEAPPLTQHVLPPGTPAYRSPEAWRFLARFRHDPSARYTATPADDLFALGVTAYRLVTDEHPPPTDPAKNASGVWSLDSVGPTPPAVLNDRVELRLSALIMKMLSVRPEERGTAGALAAQLEQAAQRAGPEADRPLFALEEQTASSEHPREASITELLARSMRRRHPKVVRQSTRYDEAERAEFRRQEAEDLARSMARTERDPSRTPTRLWRYSGIAAAVGLLMVVELGPVGLMQAVKALAAEGSDGRTVGLGDEARLSAGEMAEPTSHEPGIRLDMPPKPFDRQHRPPCRKGEVEVRGGCWAKTEARVPDCPRGAYEWNGGCYVPIIPAPAPATSDPQ
jgi:serine/threonine protein kinase